jgi:hypothetical protein
MTTIVHVADMKYSVILHDDGTMEALRYEEPWRDLTGDKLVYNLAYELNQVRQTLQQLRTLHSEVNDIFDIQDNYE